jgi:hypothetical protein
MPRGGGAGRGFGGGFGGRGGGFGGRRMGMPFFGGGYGGMGGYGYGGGMGMGSPLLTTLMAGGLGYMAGSNSAQQAAPAYPPQYLSQGSPTPPASAGGTDNSNLAQLQLLGKLHDSGVLTNDEFESEKQQILHS